MRPLRCLNKKVEVLNFKLHMHNAPEIVLLPPSSHVDVIFTPYDWSHHFGKFEIEIVLLTGAII